MNTGDDITGDITGDIGDDGTRGSIHGLTGAYVLDALDDLERARFEQHLGRCPDCRAEVIEFRETVARLADLTPTTPPPSMRENVLADIAHMRPLPPEPAEEPDTEKTTAEKTTVGGRRHLGTRARLLGAAAVVLAAVGVGTAVTQPWHTESTRPSQTQAGLIDRVLHSPDAQRISADLPGNAHATVIRSARLGRAVLLTHGLVPAPHGHVYELWLQDSGGTMRPAGLITRSGERAVLLRGDAASARAAGITIEPTGGSDQPTSAPIALFDFHST